MQFKVYEEFNPELENLWQNFYIKNGATYSLNYEWCHTWFRHFGEGKRPFIITGWKGDDLKFVAPFYKNEKQPNRLLLIGTAPDFLDEFDILYKDQDSLLELVNFIFEHHLEMDIQFVSSVHPFFKYFVRRGEQEKLYNLKVHPYTLKLMVQKTGKYADNTSLNLREIRKKGNIAQRQFNDEIVYEMDTEKNNETFDEFLQFHHQKWEALKNRPKSEFLRDLYLNYDFVKMAKLSLKNSNKSIAYGLSYMPSNNVFYYNICAFNHDYYVLSPGICIFCHNLKSDFFKVAEYLDFGNGTFDYKYRFANSQKVILNIQANLSWKRHKNIYYPLKLFKERIQKYAV